MLELSVKVYQILFIVWIVVFAMWLFKQFGDYNRRKDRE
jgi:flagellar biogenesis protein FliO